jgi:hypothetical protein
MVQQKNKMNDQYEFEFHAKTKLAIKFELFHSSNPHVYQALVTLARRFRAKNRSAQTGISMLYEVLRWEYYLATDSEDDYKLCNSYRAFYARLIMQNEPDLEGIFNLKQSVADE